MLLGTNASHTTPRNRATYFRNSRPPAKREAITIHPAADPFATGFIQATRGMTNTLPAFDSSEHEILRKQDAPESAGRELGDPATIARLNGCRIARPGKCSECPGAAATAGNGHFSFSPGVRAARQSATAARVLAPVLIWSERNPVRDWARLLPNRGLDGNWHR